MTDSIIVQEKTFGGITFLFEEKTVDNINLYEVVEIYNKVTILESINPKFTPGDTIDQISICSTIYFERNDGSSHFGNDNELPH